MITYVLFFEKVGSKKQEKIKNIQSRDLSEDEFDEIYQNNFEHLYVFAKSMTKSEELSKDVVSEVFLNLWKNRAKFSQIREIESYLFIAVKNHSIRALTNDYNKKVTIGFGSAVRMIDKVDPEELLLEKELLEDIEQAVSKLPPQCQLIYRMAKDEQLKYKEIADDLGISIASVKTQLVKAAAVIREAIKRKYDHKEDDQLSNFSDSISILLLIGLLSDHIQSTV